MKKILLILFLFPYYVFSQAWTWMHGPDTCSTVWTGDYYGSYGTKNIPSPTNFPGSGAASQWTDNSGNLWIFGGARADSIYYSNGGYLNDLWKFDVVTLQWTWVSGTPIKKDTGNYSLKAIASNTIYPSGRIYPGTCKDNSGNFWLFGGESNTSKGFGYLDDLWKFDPVTKKWTWVFGKDSLLANSSFGTIGVTSSSNHPGSRYLSTIWPDNSGNIMMYSGKGPRNASCSISNPNWEVLNDIWKFDPVSLKWTWIKGSGCQYEKPVYGTKGVPSPTIHPGCRWNAATGSDSNGNLYVFGGLVYTAFTYTPVYGPTYEIYNDLWKYNITTNNWVWLSGDSTKNSYGTYGIKNIPAPNNSPGARQGQTFFCDNSNSMWLWGGYGYCNPGKSTSTGWMNDMWKFDTSINEWVWVHGNDSLGGFGKYGMKTITQNSNLPGGRSSNGAYSSATNMFWTFGGGGAYKNGCMHGGLDDTWKFDLSFSTGIEKNNPNDKLIFIYPNPSIGEFIISIFSVSENTSIEIYNTLGQIIKREPLVDLKTKINLTGQANGIYFVKVIENGNAVYYSKIVKQ